MGNTTENLAIDLVLTCLGLFLGGEQQSDLQRKLIIGYTLCRVGHTFSFIAGLQPWRKIFYVSSKACVGTIAYKGFKNFSS